MTTLVLVSHPQLADSTSQQFLKESLPSTGVKWEHIEGQQALDVDQEQAQLRQADRIIFQFPLYWYAAPAGLKTWEDTVLTRTFVYGDHRYPLAGKELGIVVTTGMPQQAFQRGGAEGLTLDAALAPLAALAHRARMTWLPVFPIYQFGYLEEPEKLQLVIDYQRYLTQRQPDSLANRQDWFAQQLPGMVANLPTEQQATGKLIASVFDQNREQLDQLTDTLAMIKEQEDD
ncbi:NAD(P)H-dependent oxidoreductase [Levilactobacillus tujiorum]|uniref:NAD(P)H-dependent oxidoreductase n=1 Tax=Levilactobacillus tujiorum TaxID=2912243 RepID=A0ABX1L4J6_9LACO|nr:NAD(P)H-dependent oxidoreductase [Levilactobacillus tujiorum]MCH5464641.1 NAD(P)H-dependent oxidoreductase [Levilactobacillus tujiorum]NLR11677.1 NAD(P)H-dependent oxidoreductase [Lactobacillus sp. HBUAS51387]NLR29598.1 NAD(P)H-dependent oxidoreductase [Levilactobacillus tujiorum]